MSSSPSRSPPPQDLEEAPASGPTPPAGLVSGQGRPRALPSLPWSQPGGRRVLAPTAEDSGPERSLPTLLRPCQTPLREGTGGPQAEPCLGAATTLSPLSETLGHRPFHPGPRASARLLVFLGETDLSLVAPVGSPRSASQSSWGSPASLQDPRIHHPPHSADSLPPGKAPHLSGPPTLSHLLLPGQPLGQPWPAPSPGSPPRKEVPTRGTLGL